MIKPTKSAKKLSGECDEGHFHPGYGHGSHPEGGGTLLKRRSSRVLVSSGKIGKRALFRLSEVWYRTAEIMTEWETAPAVAESPEIKLFGKWSTDDVQINDISLQDYIAVKEKYAKYLPHSGGRYAAKRFRKAQCPIVERLTNSMMMHGRNNGKKLMTVRIVKHAFEIIHLLTGENPLQVLVNAIINSGPREDSTRIGRAGTVRRQAVDVSPLRRVNQAIWLLCTGAREAAFRNIKTIAECLADELINAAKGSSNSYAIKKKDELERVAKSNR
ncbi:ribosomal protein S5 [Ilyodon furcidens]|uniref:Small ribosomal subunit protein uS7 n=1 Tax=Ilyodon furcidens TaxID=33524 RepID=A0ABV0V274_9TELE